MYDLLKDEVIARKHQTSINYIITQKHTSREKEIWRSSRDTESGYQLFELNDFTHNVMTGN